MSREDASTGRARPRRDTRERSRRHTSTERAARTTLTVIAVCVGAWLLMRIAFFVGIAGSDDLRYIRYAVLWDRVPVNSWETHTLGNALIRLSMIVFGRNEVAYALPSLVASLLTLGGTLYWCLHRGCIRYAYWGGMLVAVLPVDVEMSTTVSPYSVMVGFMAVGTVVTILHGHSRRGRLLAPLLLSVGFVTHWVGAYYILALAIGLLCVDWRKYLPAIGLTVAGCAAGLVIEMGVLQVTVGDPWARFSTDLIAAGHTNVASPFLDNGSLNVDFFLTPIRSLFLSKAFGVSLVLVMFVGLRRVQGLDAPDRILVVTTVMFWLWMSFGSVVPWRYAAFDRSSYLLQPLTFSVGALFAVLIASRRNWWVSTGGASVVVAICVGNLMGGGSWGQNAHISSELLGHVQDNRGSQFLCDHRTANELYILNGVRPVGNIVVFGNHAQVRLLDEGAVTHQPTDASIHADEILVNALNLPSAPAFASYVRQTGGEVTFQTRPRYRPLALLFRPLLGHPWSVRKPPGVARICREPDRVRLVRRED